MTINISVRGFRGIDRADIECSPTALAAATNAQGKTSLCQAVAAALTGDALQGLANKGTAGVLVRTGAKSGSVNIRSDSGEFRVGWPECSTASAGKPPTASVYAAGTASIVDLDDKGRARVLSEYLHSDLTKEDFAEEMKAVGVGDDGIITGLWNLIGEHGWDGAHEKRRERGTLYKGEWRGITGQNYGSRKAESWEPEGWTEDLAGQTDRELEAAVADAKAARDRALAGDAATAERRRMLGDEADKLSERQAELDTAAAALADAETALKVERERRDALPSTRSGAGMSCPHCGEHVVIVQINLAESRLEKATVVPSDELKKRRDDKASADGEVSSLEAKLSDARRKVAAAEIAIEIARHAKTELDETPLPPAGGSVTAADADIAVGVAEKRLASFNTKAAADAIHSRIVNNEAALKVMAADGLRARKLAQVLDVFNGTQLAPLSEAAGWKAVEVDAGMVISYGGRRYSLLSESEKFRVRVVLQVAMAKLDGSSMIVVDGSDILDGPQRSGLFGLLAEVEISALVAMTLSRRDQVPDLAAAGLGRSFWVSDGIAEPIDAVTAEAA